MTLNNTNITVFTKEYYDLLRDFSNELQLISDKLSSDDTLIENVKNIVTVSTTSEFISFCIFYDLCQICNVICDGNLKKDSLEMLGLISLTSKVRHDTFDIDFFLSNDYQTIANALLLEDAENLPFDPKRNVLHILYDMCAEDIIKFTRAKKPLKFTIIKVDDNKSESTQKLENILSLLPALKILDHPFFSEYADLLYKFSQIIANADKVNVKGKEISLKELYRIIYNSIPEEILTLPTRDISCQKKNKSSADNSKTLSEKPIESQTIYTKINLKQPGFIQRLFKTQPKENAIADLNNLLAKKPIKEIKLEEIEAISEKYEVNFYKEYADKLKELYLIYLKHCLEDKLLTDTEIDELSCLKHLLGITDSDIDTLHNKIATEIYKKSFEAAISDGRLEKEEQDFLQKLQNNLKLPIEMAYQISNESKNIFINNYISGIISDERLSTDELNELDEIAKSLNVKLEMDDATKERLSRFKLYWTIENGQMPTIQVEITLPKGENCYFYSAVDWFETRTITQKINYAGPSVRLKIWKGFYYRAGSVNLERITSEKLLLIDSGTIYLTNKRLIFVGAKKNTNIKLNKILSIVPYSDGIGIEKDTGKSPILKVANPDIFSMTIGRLINDVFSLP